MITRSEAIKQLRLLKADITNGLSFVSKTKDKHPALESLSIAIASLETDEAYDLEYEQPEFCKDCISREAVYYYISSHINEIITESGTDKNAHTNAILRSLANGVKTMPSVLPKVTMNDLGVDVVSRKALLDATVKKNSVWNKITNSEGDNLETIIAKLPPVTPQEPRWISVSERLPECCGMYIVTRKIYDCPDTAPIFMSDESWFDGQNTWHNDNRINHERGYLSDVIAWMPLPKPYEPQESEG